MKRTRALPIAALALAVGLAAAAPAAAAGDPAAPTVSAPRSSPVPGFHGEGRYSSCYTNPYSGSGAGWIGNGDVTVSATAASPSGEAVETTFQLWDTAYGGKRTVQTAGSSRGPRFSTRFTAGNFVDGGQYGWRARATDGKLTSPYTPWCYFRVDKTPPTAKVTTDAKPKKVGQEASFTLHGTDTGSEIACARWQTQQTFGVGWKCSDEATDLHVVRLVDGKADIKVKPETWGSQAVYLETMDNAGNVSQRADLSYYAQSSTAPVALGDIDADGKPDVLAPDAAGNLNIRGADPRDTPSAHASEAPGDLGSWARVQYTHRGSFYSDRVDDLVAHAPGGSHLYLFHNAGLGHFTEDGPVIMDKPSTCKDAAHKVIDCVKNGLGEDWSKVTGIAAYGSPRGDTPADGQYVTRTSLLFVENGRLWLVESAVGPRLRDEATLISGNTTRWAGYDLLTPGRAQGTDFPTLWARSQKDGTVRAFTIKGTPAAPDFSAFANPSAGPVLTTLAPAAHPRVGSDGDLTGDGIPDLWSADASGKVTVFPGKGTAKPYPTVTGFGAGR
ncbi:VCBS repeat-containing protein [Streptomyces sp. G1]|uniref:FG-GAP repeat domain-containing protein n=1 Tax=Streptomyces sp. G1 TaxID=361572 RepID=UPI00202F1248|nr:VCBS repeat-containing protein [Streptomyces sp. G1]MCM1973293.1 VCBS repeat-containing protein [Streptomyces sp. G1]